jgi:hypothetical protein
MAGDEHATMPMPFAREGDEHEMMPMPFGQDEALATLRRLDPTAARTLLFAGPGGVGRRLTARWYAALVNCDAGLDDPCGRCASCQTYRSGEGGALAASDYREIAAPSTTRDGRVARRLQIPIDLLVAREGGHPEPLGPWLTTPPRHRRRVGVVDGAELLTESAANAFLKTLEEPPQHASIILIAPGPDALLPTVASRCVTVRFRPVAADDTAWSVYAPHPAVRLGLPGPLRALAHDAAFATARESVASFVTALDGGLDDTFAALAALDAAWEGGDVVPGMLREHARRRGAAAYVAADAAIDAAERALAAYAHRGLVLKHLALDLRRAWRSG